MSRSLTAVPAALSALAEVRSRPCPLCDALPGDPCQQRPAGDHLARWLSSYVSGQLTRQYLAMVLGELVVLDIASSIIPAQRGGTR